MIAYNKWFVDFFLFWQLFSNIQAQSFFYPNISYGTDSLQKFDYWVADPIQLRPVVIYFHGGAFRSGDKSLSQRHNTVKDYFIAHGISFISSNYRLSRTTRVDSILSDSELLIRFIKKNAAQFHIDSSAIGVYGSSAGGCLALWLALNPNSSSDKTDTLVGISTKISVAGHITSPASVDMRTWSQIIGLDSNWMVTYNYNEDLNLYKIKDRSSYLDSFLIRLLDQINILNYLDADDTPVFYHNNNNPNPVPQSTDFPHHGRHAIYLDSLSQIIGHRHLLNQEQDADQALQSMCKYFCEYLECLPTGISVHDDSYEVKKSDLGISISVKFVSSNYCIELINDTGQVIWNIKSNNSELIIPISVYQHLSSGLLILRIRTDQMTFAHRFYKD